MILPTAPVTLVAERIGRMLAFSHRRTRSTNRIGVSVCRTTPVSGLASHVQDTIDGTPVMDIKPVTTGFRPRGGVKEPDRAREIMERYWQ
jgi:tRNA (Thr-GGU) A37 N-methylase